MSTISCVIIVTELRRKETGLWQRQKVCRQRLTLKNSLMIMQISIIQTTKFIGLISRIRKPRVRRLINSSVWGIMHLQTGFATATHMT